MSRTVIPVTTLSRSGAGQPSQTDSDESNGMYVASNNGRIFLEIENTDAGTQTVGFALSVDAIDGVAVPDKTVSLAAGDIKLVGGFPTSSYNQNDGTLHVNPSVDTNLKFRAYKLPNS